LIDAATGEGVFFGGAGAGEKRGATLAGGTSPREDWALWISVCTSKGGLPRGGIAGWTSCMEPVALDMERFPEGKSDEEYTGISEFCRGDTRTGFASILCPPGSFCISII